MDEPSFIIENLVGVIFGKFVRCLLRSITAAAGPQLTNSPIT